MTEEDICGEEKNDGQPCDYTPKYDDGKCGIHTDHTDTDPGGRPSKFEEVKDDLLDAADGYINLKQVANKGGVSRSTLYQYLDEYEEFSDSFKRARGAAADQLVQRALDPEDEIDITFARFLLERSFKFIKTERQEVEMDVEQTTTHELGELAQAILHHEYEGGDAESVMDELRDLAVLGYAIYWKRTEYPQEVLDSDGDSL